jgi:hypothetical protein
VDDLAPLAEISLRRDMLSAGMDDDAIARLVRGGVLARVRRGAYVDGESWRHAGPTLRHRLVVRAVLRQACTEVVVSHLSALTEWDVPLWDTALDLVDITRVDQRAGRREAGVRQHLGRLRPSDVVERHGIRVTSPARTALDAMTLLDAEHSLAVVNDLLHRRLTTRHELDETRLFMERWPRTLHQKLVLSLSTELSESVGESRLLYLCWRQRLPPPVLQYAVRDATGRVVARVDAAWPVLGVFAEFDGRVKYEALVRPGESATDAVVREKRREDLIRELTGWRCVRVTWAELYDQPGVAARLRQAFGRGASRGGA